MWSLQCQLLHLWMADDRAFCVGFVRIAIGERFGSEKNGFPTLEECEMRLCC